MSNSDLVLKRLLQAASKAPHLLDTTLPLGFETRVLAHWQSVADQSPMTPFFSRALLTCTAVMVLTVALSYGIWTLSPTSTELTLTNSAIEMSLP